MEKIKCYNCDFFAEASYLTEKGQAYCRYLDAKIPHNNEKTRCKHYALTDVCFRCKNFCPWVETSKGETNHACVIGTNIRQCPQFNHPERCEQYENKYGL